MQIQGNMLRIINHKEKEGIFSSNKGKSEDRKTIFIGKNTAEQESSFVTKRKEAQKKAGIVIKNAFEEELALDKKIEESNTTINTKNEKIKEANKQILELEEQKEKMKDSCSKEEYASYCAGIAKQQSALYKEISEAQKVINDENASIKNIKKARLQSTNIHDALNEADNIMEAVSKEIIHDAATKIKENMDKYMEQKKEEAEKKKEKQEEKEELREESKEYREGHQSANAIQTATETLISLEQLQSAKKQELKNILQEYSLTPEDIKGASVDTVL